MNSMNWLERLKEKEDPIQLVPLINNPDVQTIISVWPNIKITIRKKLDLAFHERDADEDLDMEEFWSRIEFDPDDIALATGIDCMQIPRLFEIAKKNRLIYPDGTVNRLASKYLRQIIINQLSATVALTTGKKKDAKSSNKG